MADVIQLQRQHADPYALLSGAVRQYEDALQQQREERTRGQQLDLQRGQLDLGNRELASSDAARTGTLKLQQDTFSDQQKKAQADQFIELHIKPLFAAGDTAGAAKLIQQYTTEKPDMLPYLAAAAQGRAATPAEEASGNVGKFSRTQTGIAASGGTDPNAVNFTTKLATKDWMPKEGFTQQQATDLGSRAQMPGGAPNLKATVPKPSGNAVGDFEARSVGAMTDAGQNQTSQTQITTEGMRQSGETKRQGMVIQAAKEKEASKVKGDAQVVVQGVLDDPQSFYALPVDSKKLVLQTLGRAPSKLSSAEIDRSNTAMMGRQLIDDADALVKKWQARGTPITGPVLGRFNAAEGKWGELVLPKNMPPDQQAEYAQDISQLREWLTALPVAEAKALAGGRTAYQVIQAITSSAPSMSKDKDMFEGSVKGLRTRFTQIEDTLDKKQWGGKLPEGYKTTRERMGGIDPKLQEFMSKNGIADEATARKALRDAGIPGY